MNPQAQAFLDEIIPTLEYLYNRWQDESRFENIDDYKLPLLKTANKHKVEIDVMNKHPFGFEFILNNETYRVTINSKDINCMKKAKTPAIVPESTIIDGYTDIKLLKKQHMSRKIIIDPLGVIHCYPDAEAKVDETTTIDVEFKNFDEFEARPIQTILTYHEQFFKCEPPKKQTKTLTALQIWAYFLREGKPHLPNVNAETGEKIRKSSIAGRQYFKGESYGKPHEVKTFQALKCINIFTDALGTNPAITEEDLKAAIIKRATELKTKQDPWRIFQYYRPQLIKAKLIKHD